MSAPDDTSGDTSESEQRDADAEDKRRVELRNATARRMKELRKRIRAIIDSNIPPKHGSG